MSETASKTHGQPYRFGLILKNNAVVVKSLDNLNGRRFVLAYHTNEWVTWEVDTDGYCYHGHYFGDEYLLRATNDFYVRSGRGE
ncbi:MAG: hypothetical protein H0U53_10995 [Actinobacteria bacterium]|nr:hypothetical protein [Actinomycetota bacterium]